MEPHLTEEGWRCGGLIIGLEGIDGSGKTTVAGIVAEWFERSRRSVVVCRTGGTLLADDYPLQAGDDRLRVHRFLESLVNSAVADQYHTAHSAARVSDVLVLDKTYLSYLMGKSRTHQVSLNSDVLQESRRQLSSMPDFVTWDLLLYVYRPPEQIVAALTERQRQGISLCPFEQLLLSRPGFIESEQARLGWACQVLNGIAILNTGSVDYLRAQVEQVLDRTPFEELRTAGERP